MEVFVMIFIVPTTHTKKKYWLSSCCSLVGFMGFCGVCLVTAVTLLTDFMSSILPPSPLRISSLSLTLSGYGKVCVWKLWMRTGQGMDGRV